MSGLEVTGLSVVVDRFTRGATAELLTDISFSLEEGQSLAIIGASGSGKSVLIRALSGLIPSTGTVSIGAVSSERDGFKAIQSRIGVLMSQPGLLDDLTLFDNIAFKLRRDGVSESEIDRRVSALLADFGLAASRDVLPASLSGGMRRRGALARALVHEPQCLLLDDPTAGLDPITTTSVIELIFAAARSRGASVVVTTHDLDGVAARATRVMMLRSARLVPLDGERERWATELGA